MDEVPLHEDDQGGSEDRALAETPEGAIRKRAIITYSAPQSAPTQTTTSYVWVSTFALVIVLLIMVWLLLGSMEEVVRQIIEAIWPFLLLLLAPFVTGVAFRAATLYWPPLGRVLQGNPATIIAAMMALAFLAFWAFFLVARGPLSMGPRAALLFGVGAAFALIWALCGFLGGVYVAGLPETLRRREPQPGAEEAGEDAA